MIAGALGCLCWHLKREDLTSARAGALLIFAREVEIDDVFRGALAFDEHLELQEKLNQLGRDSQAKKAVIFTRAVLDAKVFERPVPPGFIDTAVVGVAFLPANTVHLHLETAKSLVEWGLCDSRQFSVMEEALARLWNKLDYGNLLQPPVSTDWQIIAPLARAACVSLAQALRLKGRDCDVLLRWCGAAEADPLPEVRYALRG